MKCSNCQREIADNSKFCVYCGTTIEDAALNQPVKKITKKTLMIPFVIIAAIFAVIIANYVSVNQKNTLINLNNYVNIEFMGYEGSGEASLSLNSEKLYADLKENCKSAKNKNDSLNLVYNSIQAYLDKSQNLCTGDQVTLHFTFDNEAANKIGIQLKGNSQTFRVTGLAQISEVDPFEKLEVSFYGTSSTAVVQIVNNAAETELQDLKFTAEPDSGLSNGDEVIISVDSQYYDQAAFIEKYGYKLSVTSKKYICTNLDEYVTSAENITDELLKKMNTQAKDVVNAQFGYWKSNCSNVIVQDKKYVGYYFLKNKNISENDKMAKNKIYFVYSAQISNPSEKIKKQTIYFPVCFENILCYGDGTEEVDLETEVEGKRIPYCSYHNWTMGCYGTGYTSQNDMKESMIMSQADNYIIETYGDLK